MLAIIKVLGIIQSLRLKSITYNILPILLERGHECIVSLLNFKYTFVLKYIYNVKYISLFEYNFHPYQNLFKPTSNNFTNYNTQYN